MFTRHNSPSMPHHLLFFGIFNVLLYLFISIFHSIIPFNSENYTHNAHHFIPDPQSIGKPFNLLSGLAQFDAQWYLKIAIDGYQYSPDESTNLSDKSNLGNLTYAFMPGYPSLIWIFQKILSSPELAAFVSTNLILLLNFVSFYYVACRFVKPDTAIKSAWLFFSLPFSIFFRSYYAENLLLFLSLWFIHFLVQKKFLLSAIFLSVLNIVKGRVFPLNILLLVAFILHHRHAPQKLIAHSPILLITILPLSFWIAFNYFSTGNPLFFSSVISVWEFAPPILILIHNLTLILGFIYLPFHLFHYSQVDIVILFVSLILLYQSRTSLKPELWWYCALLSLFPLLTIDLMSYSRYQMLCFPLVIYLTSKLNSKMYYLSLITFIVLLFWVSLYFVNWHWIG